MLDSLVRVSRREKENHFVLNSKQQSPHPFPAHQNSKQHQPQRPKRKRLGKCGMVTTDFLRFLFSNFRYSLTALSRGFASFPHGTCMLSVSHQYLALDGIYHPLRAAIPNNSTPGIILALAGTRESHPLCCPVPGDLAHKRDELYNIPQFDTSDDSHFGLLELHSPLLLQSWLVSFPPLSNMLKFSGSFRFI
jgi:hypothetical protein